jgi:hypothetical protein
VQAEASSRAAEPTRSWAWTLGSGKCGTQFAVHGSSGGAAGLDGGSPGNGGSGGIDDSILGGSSLGVIIGRDAVGGGSPGGNGDGRDSGGGALDANGLGCSSVGLGVGDLAVASLRVSGATAIAFGAEAMVRSAATTWARVAASSGRAAASQE